MSAAEQTSWHEDAGVIEVRRIGDMFIDTRYQRTIKQAKVEKIVREFDPRIVGTPTVSERKGGRLAVVSGQHRVIAMRELGILTWPVRVMRGLSRADEASIFTHEARGTSPLSRYDEHKASLVSGDPPARAIELIATELGFKVVGSGSHDGNLTCVAALYYVHDTYSADALALVLSTISAAWGMEKKQARSGMMIRGLATFYARHGHEIDRDGFIDNLRSTTAHELLQNASETVRLAGGAAEQRVYQHIGKQYNKRRKSRRIEIAGLA